ncbi:chemotaxis protein CheD [Sphingomonas sp.]|uniref:chemotaxis protein CheD n=1 Tax=Sphingomonas sp. TaxID=28214 RepID=UPI001B17E254|nr:chemotaxis protein CheD [Sphingomonas sp.]MBO9713473.1 chemotaxis protein CheD [Sphingomonas sp.]
MRRVPIVQGEFAAIAEPDVMITTLLGSCVAACFYDPVARIGGMNHFLLGEPDSSAKLSGTDLQRYGVHAMELLINAMMGKGAVRSRLRAHLYGGANIVSGLGAIGSSNAAFARRFMETEGIAIGHCDLGGTSARKVEFLPHEGRSRCTHVTDRVAEKPIIPIIPASVPGGELELF